MFFYRYEFKEHEVEKERNLGKKETQISFRKGVVDMIIKK